MADIDKEKIEAEPNLAEMFGEILKRHDEARRAEVEGGPEWLETRLKELPESAKRAVREYDEKLAVKGLAPADRADLVEERVTAIEQTYIDRRFTVDGETYLPRDVFSKERAIMWFKDLLDEQPTPDDLKKIARLSFDANGLKAVNDLSGSHEKGTAYLQRIAQIFHASAREDHPIGKRLRQLGIREMIPVLGGGDEYSVIVKAEHPISPEVLDEATRLYEEAVAALEVDDLIDFNHEETQLRYLGVSRAEFTSETPDERAATLKKFRDEIPEGFAMRASISGGGATLFEGFYSALKDPRAGKKIASADAYSRVLEKIIGGLWDASDRVAIEHKVVFKEALREGSREDRAYSMVLSRTTEVRVLEVRLEALSRDLAEARALDRDTEELEELLAKGVIDEATYGRIVREKRQALKARSRE